MTIIPAFRAALLLDVTALDQREAHGLRRKHEEWRCYRRICAGGFRVCASRRLESLGGRTLSVESHNFCSSWNLARCPLQQLSNFQDPYRSSLVCLRGVGGLGSVDARERTLGIWYTPIGWIAAIPLCKGVDVPPMKQMLRNLNKILALGDVKPI